MKRHVTIIALVSLMLFSGFRSFEQDNIIQSDSLQIQTRKGQSETQAKEQNTNVRRNQNATKENGNQAVKSVMAGRPDMTRARGARPPLIVRPSGSGIPKGVGKPGGAGHKGGR